MHREQKKTIEIVTKDISLFLNKSCEIQIFCLLKSADR